MRQDLDSMTYVASLSGLGTGGPDDNDGQGGRLVANGLVKRYGKGTDSDATDTLVFAGHGEGEAQVANALKVPSHGANWQGGSADTFVAFREDASVRRLTPVECERLQALPDGWTQLGNTADSKRYAALGDAVTASVAEWIGRRLLQHLRVAA